MRKRSKKASALLLTLVLCLSALFGISAAQAQIVGGTPNPDLEASENLAFNDDAIPFEGIQWQKTLYNQNFKRGTDLSGNLILEPDPATGMGFHARSDKKVYLDGFSVLFRIDPLFTDYEIKTGANWTFGLAQAEGQQDITAGITVCYNEELNDGQGGFEFYFQSIAGSTWPALFDSNNPSFPGAADFQAVDIATLAEGDLKTVRPTLGDPVRIELRYLNYQEAKAFGASMAPRIEQVAPHFYNTYYLFINDQLIDFQSYYGNELEENENGYDVLPGLAPFLGGDGVQAQWGINFPQEPAGAPNEYGWFYYYDNAFPNQATPHTMFPRTPVPDHHAARVTIFELGGDNVDGGAFYDSGEIQPNQNPAKALPVYGENFLYGNVRLGMFANDWTFRPSGEEGYFVTYESPVLLAGAEVPLAIFKDGGNYVSASETVLTYRASAEADAASFGVRILRERADAQVLFTVGQNSYPTQFTAEQPMTVSVGEYLYTHLFWKDSEFSFFVNGVELELTEEASSALMQALQSFDAAGFVTVGNPTADQKIVLGRIVEDGTATVRLKAVSIVGGAGPEVRSYTRGTADEAAILATFADKLTIRLGDGSTTEVGVAWTGTVRPNVPGIYRFVGEFTDSEGNLGQYIFEQDLLQQLSFDIEIMAEAEYQEYGSSSYTGKDWVSPPSILMDPFYYYKDADGYEHMMSNPTLSEAFTPYNVNKVDVDGYRFQFRLTSMSEGGGSLVIFTFMHKSGTHPVSTGVNVFQIYLTTNGQGRAAMELAYGQWVNGSVSSGRPKAMLYDPEANQWFEDVAFDNTGETEYEWSMRFEEGVYNLYLTAEGRSYRLVMPTEAQPAPTSSPQEITDLIASTFENGEEPGGAKMYVMLWNQIGKNELVFRQEYTKYIVSYEVPGNRFVTFGEPHGLPEKLTATLNTGETLEVNVDYGNTYDPELAQTQTLTGTISLPEGVTIGRGEVFTQDVRTEFEVEVTVSPEIRLITAVEGTADLRIMAGETPSFPDKLRVTFEDGTSEEISVVWTSENFNGMIAGTYEFTANPVGNYSFADSALEQAAVQVVVEAPAEGGCGGAAAGSASLLSAVLLGLVGLLGIRRQKD